MLHARTVLTGSAAVLLSAAIMAWTLAPRLQPPQLSEDAGAVGAVDLYHLRTTTVEILVGSIFDLGPKYTDAAIAVSAKFNLGEPFDPASANSLLEKLVTKKDPDRTARYRKQLEKIADANDPDLVWADSLPPEWKLGSHSIYLLAGIPAWPGERKEPEEVTESKPRKIEAGVELLCRAAAADGVNMLAMTFFGTGAARVGEPKASRAILSGISRAAAAGKAPAQVIVVLYPDDKGASAQERKAWLDQTTVFFRSAVSDRRGGLSYRATYDALAQLFVLLLAPVLSAFIGVRTVGRALWWGPIVHSVVKWGLVASGFFALSQTGFSNLTPLSGAHMFVLVGAGLVMPLWDWHEMSKIKRAQPQGQTV